MVTIPSHYKFCWVFILLVTHIIRCNDKYVKGIYNLGIVPLASIMDSSSDEDFISPGPSTSRGRGKQRGRVELLLKCSRTD